MGWMNENKWLHTSLVTDLPLREENCTSVSPESSRPEEKRLLAPRDPGFVALRRKLSPYMVNDVTRTWLASWEIPDNSISRNCGGAWWTYGAALRVYNLTIIPRLALLDVWLRTGGSAGSRFRKFLGGLKKNRGDTRFLVHPSKTRRVGLYRLPQ